MVLGGRLAARHAVSRTAFGWAVVLAALTRILAGPSPEAVGPMLAGLAGLLGAAAGPRPFVRGGPFESLRWVGIPPTAAAAARVAGTVAFASLGAAAAGFALAGPAALDPRALTGATLHAAVVGGLAAALAPGVGCQAATVLPLLLVAAGAAAPYGRDVIGTGPPAALAPPGVLVARLFEGRIVGPAAGIGLWLTLAALGVTALGRRVSRRRSRSNTPVPESGHGVAFQHLTSLDTGGAGGRPVLDDVTLTVHGGEIVAVVGVPLEGPSALLRVAAGLRPAERGHVVAEAGRPRPAAGFGYVRAGLTGPAELTIVEWLRYVADHYGGPARARALRAQAALALVGLGPEAGRRIGLLDRDAVERLAVAACAVSGTAVLLLDGCFAGVHAATRQVLTDALADLAVQGRAVLLAPRDVRTVESLATRVVVLRDGRVLADLRMSALQQERVAELRLNGGALAAVPQLAAHFPDAVRTGTGVDVPLARGRTLESVLAVCRSERIPVLGTRVRYRAVDDLLHPAVRAPDPARAATLG
jgi:ABC-type multidrug transport system ATPase subunit